MAARKTVEENQHRMSNQPMLITETKTNPHPTINQGYDSTEIVNSSHTIKTSTTNSSINCKSKQISSTNTSEKSRWENKLCKQYSYN